MVNKSEFIRALAKHTGLSMGEARTVVHALFDPAEGIISSALQSGADVRIAGFGTFRIAERSSRTGRNPQTGEAMVIAAKRIPQFKPALGLKDRAFGVRGGTHGSGGGIYD